MKNSTYGKALAILILPCIFAPAVRAEYYDFHQGYSDPNGHQRAEFYRHHDRDINEQLSNREYDYRYERSDLPRVAAGTNEWLWDQHDWNSQRSQLRENWRERHDRLSTLQQEELNNQMRAQWLQYHDNQWNGQYTWDQYSDPGFLDYIHSRNPSLLTTIRSYYGY